ncbi:solute carrier family 53 member 1-like [Saccoglossus kowalevskii]|uniref:Xenotropic and polytropic retrovirus receptor 1-like n=1 Tax=Saccoglossus kowalevskii TaxID=10224 RepID=A0ABM0MGL5_SACKO|nr:PREDICTED: xenotropic and polytropic retrovirus receptor 1-like [Saccoglossus kowalevskii]
MKFTEHLSAHITPEWRKQYIEYEVMKNMLYDAIENAPSVEVSGESAVQRHFARFEENFFKYSDKELAKINTFFSEKLAEVTRKFANLQDELRQSSSQESKDNLSSLRMRKSVMFALADKNDQKTKLVKSHTRKINDLKLAFSEFYLSLILIQNYQNLNFTGFRKILKKHDKLLETDRGVNFRVNLVEAAPFFTSKQIDKLILETEQLYITDLEGGNRHKAMRKLRVPPLGDRQTPWTTFRFGFFSGTFVILCASIILAGVFTDHSDDWRPAVRMYRGCFVMIFSIFLLGINTYGWRKAGVNHVLIFEIDPRNHLNYEELLEVAMFFGVLWALSVLGYLFSDMVNLPPLANPLALVGFMVIFLLNPTRTLYYRARFWLLRILCRIFLAPFFPVRFADFWLADQLNSLVAIFLDLQYLICFYSFTVDWLGKENNVECYSYSYGIRSVVACLPAWWRFAQCLRRYYDSKQAFPHLVNAGKYSTTFFVVLFSSLAAVYKAHYGNIQDNPFFYLWIGSAVISSSYALTWDIKMDWGLLDKNAGENKFLREEIVYPYKAYYYLAVFEDLILRFAWTLTVSVGEMNYFDSDILVTILSPLEVFRRFVWNFFRLENEHLNNCGQFRAVRDISIAPLSEDDVAQLETMMDEEDGVINRKSDKKNLISVK